jgi:DNA processing protein
VTDFDQQTIYRIAVTLIPGIGNMNAKKLIAWCDDPEAVFSEPKELLLKIPGMVKLLGKEFNRTDLLKRAEQELNFIVNSNIDVLYYYDADYPRRLKQCADSPLVLFYKGQKDIFEKRMLAVVGTRKATAYGKRICQEIIEGFKGDDILIVSGMAYGIDSCAHRKALGTGLLTIGVMGHGLDRIYPHENRNMAARMIRQGGLLTEFLSNSKPDRENFPKRNRIIAGLSDAVLVVESASRGGAIITAEIASSYNRDVFAVPGRTSDEFSDGCHLLIRRNIAALARSADDIRYSMRWENNTGKRISHHEMLENYGIEERTILQVIIQKEKAHIDDIVLIGGLGAARTASILLKLEFEGTIAGLPGKLYEIRR